MHKKFYQAQALADLFFGAAGRPTFLSMIKADGTGRNPAVELNRWVGGINVDSRATMFGPWKAFTLLGKGDLKGVSYTPIPSFKEGCPHPGGYREDSLIVACSGWSSGVVDLMFAMLLVWSMGTEVKFHHVGFSHETAGQRDVAVAAAEAKYGVKAEFLPVEGKGAHQRHYLQRNSEVEPFETFWEEHQLWPEPEKGIHFDFATEHPEAAAEFISAMAGNLPFSTWSRSPHNPCALVQTMDDDGTDVSIMFRPEWTHVAGWPRI